MSEYESWIEEDLEENLSLHKLGEKVILSPKKEKNVLMSKYHFTKGHAAFETETKEYRPKLKKKLIDELSNIQNNNNRLEQEIENIEAQTRKITQELQILTQSIIEKKKETKEIEINNQKIQEKYRIQIEKRREEERKQKIEENRSNKAQIKISDTRITLMAQKERLQQQIEEMHNKISAFEKRRNNLRDQFIAGIKEAKRINNELKEEQMYLEKKLAQNLQKKKKR